MQERLQPISIWLLALRSSLAGSGCKASQRAAKSSRRPRARASPVAAKACRTQAPTLASHERRPVGPAGRSNGNGSTRDPTRLLERGEADLAIGHFPEAVAALGHAGRDATLRHERLQESGCVCVMRHGHPLARGELTLDGDCAAHHLLVSFSGRPNGRADQALAALNRERRVVLTVNQYFTAGQVVANSNLLTVLPASFVGAAGSGKRWSLGRCRSSWKPCPPRCCGTSGTTTSAATNGCARGPSKRRGSPPSDGAGVIDSRSVRARFGSCAG